MSNQVKYLWYPAYTPTSHGRIFTFPASALKENGRNIGYVDFVRRNAGGVLAPSLARILPRIDLDAIDAFIADTPLVSDLQRRFYSHYIRARYDALFVVHG